MLAAIRTHVIREAVNTPELIAELAKTSEARDEARAKLAAEAK